MDRTMWVRDTLAFYPDTTGPARARLIVRLKAQADSSYPPSLSGSGLEKVLHGHRGDALTQAALVCLMWPFATYATLMIFRASMRRAKVRPIHVMRCIIYGGTAAVWIGLLASSLLPLNSQRLMSGVHQRAPAMLIAAAIGLAASYHLGCAYHRYLKFDHPWATAAASQVIVWLLFCVLLVNWTITVR